MTTPIVQVGMMSFAHLHAASYAHCLTQNPNIQFVGIADPDADRAQRYAAHC